MTARAGLDALHGTALVRTLDYAGLSPFVRRVSPGCFIGAGAL